ncbi:protein serine/threonine kinase [Gracilaria domingensis]|nr:protein serine/threonine kinase [Gracilaria domingensis]
MTPLRFGCGSCDGGYYYSSDRQDCLICPPNTFSTAGVRTQCEKCPEGSVALPGSTACTTCAVGEVLLQSGCGKCKAGEGFDSYFGECVECGPNHASDGLRECTPCAPGTFAGKGSTSCSSCPNGTALDYVTGQCITCTGGQYYNVLSGQCQRCFSFPQEANGNTDRHCPECPYGIVPNADSTACNGMQNDRAQILALFLTTGSVS